MALLRRCKLLMHAIGVAAFHDFHRSVAVQINEVGSPKGDHILRAIRSGGFKGRKFVPSQAKTHAAVSPWFPIWNVAMISGFSS